MKKVKKEDRKGVNSLTILGASIIWKHRSACVFDGTAPSVNTIMSEVKDFQSLWCMAGAKKLLALGLGEGTLEVKTLLETPYEKIDHYKLGEANLRFLQAARQHNNVKETPPRPSSYASPEDGVLICLDEVVATLIFDEGCPLQLPPFTLCFRRWSRFKNATSDVLPSSIDVMLSGVPTHAWELETAEQLLNEWCWVRELHPDTLGRRDYSSFWLMAWCSRPELILAEMELVIVEPPVLVEENRSMKHALEYDIKITVTVDQSGGGGTGPPPSSPGSDSSHGRRHQLKDREDDHRGVNGSQ
ncbi:hypothetical protein PR202_ga08113 [Eleusine coracana subsp. coracana]|uniref:Uncharacterized protein n=1 Tax=Eleusine coracana subsp. coracana TaxID=191504 RepID=A0AAV5BZ77_ELECO|nr:hypothetical protein PR202_ga08113 [Eleusine coracana subsp. coracana]